MECFLRAYFFQGNRFCKCLELFQKLQMFQEQFYIDSVGCVCGGKSALNVCTAWWWLVSSGIHTFLVGSSCNDLVAGVGMGWVFPLVQLCSVVDVHLTPSSLSSSATIVSGHFDKRVRLWDLRCVYCTHVCACACACACVCVCVWQAAVLCPFIY